MLKKEQNDTKMKKIPRNRNVLKQRSSLFVLATTRGISSQEKKKLVDYYPIGVQANMHEKLQILLPVSIPSIITATITTVCRCCCHLSV